MRRDDIPHSPDLSRDQRERIRRTREALVRGGLLAAPPGRSGVPRHIEQSWRRCVGEAVPVTPDHVDYREPEDNRTTLSRAAEPVLERLKDSLADVPVAMVLSDVTGRIVVRHAAVRRQREVMDRARAAEGFDYSERSIGTNGIGTSNAAPCWFAAPSTTTPCSRTSPAPAPRSSNPAPAASSARSHWLVHAYLSLAPANTATLVVDEDTVLANRLGLSHTGPDLHPLLWRYLSEHGPDRTRRMRVPLADGPHGALVEPIRDAGKAAYSVKLLSRHPSSPAGGGATGAVTPPVVGDLLHFDDQVNRQLETAVRHHELIALTGPSGTGKLRTAVRVLGLQGTPDPLVVEPHLEPGWFGDAAAAVADGRGLVIRRIHHDPVPSVAQVRALAAPGVALAFTVDLDAAGDAAVGLVRQVATTMRLPALAHSLEHLPALVRTVSAELPEPESATTLAAPAWDRLMSWHWRGNLAELRNTVALLARRACGGTVDDLPDKLRTPRRSLSLLESAERTAVVGALHAAGGNRSRAAQALGIGRNTLYRKMREFGIT
ncbi:helix-turn-helix domain-containing protein [Amycolatopsis methanolica]|uniref:helix-turn-helix domain-containing protein n=1 Tax=Amycolatopsis methanolica TaxID=1814 RepID=UPI003419D9F8